MARIDDLIGKIQDPALKAELCAEVARMRKGKKFGLVFEEHAPEAPAGPQYPWLEPVAEERISHKTDIVAVRGIHQSHAPFPFFHGTRKDSVTH